MSLAHAPTATAAPTFARWEPVAAAFCLAQFSEPFFSAVAQSQGLTEPPGYARIFFLPVYAFLAWVMWRDRGLAFRVARAVPLLMGLIALAALSTLGYRQWRNVRRAVWLALSMGFGSIWRGDTIGRGCSTFSPRLHRSYRRLVRAGTGRAEHRSDDV